MWAFDLTGRVEDCDGRQILIEEQVTEVTFEHLGQRHVLTLARDIESNEQYMLKIRYDLNPEHLDRSPAYSRDVVTNNFLDEAELVLLVGELGHGPKYIDHGTIQSCRYPYPEGYVDMILMSRVPGEVVTDIFTRLSTEQLASIKTQLTFILETMRQNGRNLREQHPDFLRYDIENDKLYLVDFTFFSYMSRRGPPITEDDLYVLTFNIWQRHLPKTFANP